MTTVCRQRQRYRLYPLVSCTLLLLFGFIPAQLAIAYYQSPQPEAILTLGGGPEREEFTAQFAQAHPTLPIWVSTGTAPEPARKIFHKAGIPKQQVHLDYRAVDTVTNFTSLVEEFKRRDIRHVYLITADFHMPRAKAIATLILGSQGIAFTPVSFPWNEPDESALRILRDCGRAILWIATGRTGASLNPKYESLQRRSYSHQLSANSYQSTVMYLSLGLESPTIRLITDR